MKDFFLWFILFLFINTYCHGQQFGTTVITHGYQLTGVAPMRGEWMYNMAKAILEKTGGRGCICTYDKISGLFKTEEGSCLNGEVILLFDWAAESNINNAGFTEAAGDLLFASLVRGLLRQQFTLHQIHFIGHSRGAVVNTEAIERLITLKNTYPSFRNIISVDHVTNIDPHDWGILGDYTDFDNHPNLNITCPSNDKPNNGVISWSGSGFNDTYFQTNINSILNGRAVDGTYNCDWSQHLQGHTEIQQSYITSIRTFSTGVSTPCGASGYRFSRIGGETRPLTSLLCDPNMHKYSTEFDFFDPMYIISNQLRRVRGIMNGSFDRQFEKIDINSRTGSINTIRHLPGWQIVNANPVKDILSNSGIVIEAVSGRSSSVIHNWLFVPPDVKALRINLKKSSSNTGSIILKAGAEMEVSFRDTLDTSQDLFTDVYFDISRFQGRIIKFSIEVAAGSSANTFSIMLKEVAFSKQIPQNLPTLFLFDLSGSMNERMPSGVSRIEEAKAAAKATLRTMANATNQGVSQEIDIRGFSGACVSDPTFPITNGFTTDFSAVENAVNRIPIPNGGTPLFEAIQSSRQKLLQRLDQTGAKQAKLIILSDGQATCTPIRPADVYAFGQYGQTTQNISTSGNPLLSSNLRYYAVGFGIDPGSPAERDLQYLAQISGGKYLNAQNQFELTRAFQKFNKIFVPKPAPALVDVPAASRDVFDRGVSTIYAEEYETALERCKTYVQQHPEDCHGIYNFALMQEANEYYKSAIASFEKYLQLCPGADDGIHVRKQIADLKQDYEAFLIFNRKVIMSDMEYLDLHFKKIQNGQSVALAQEFIAFIKEKYSYYQNLPAILEINNRAFDSASKEVFRGLSSCIETIKRNSQTWDRDATPVLSKTYIAMERLLQTF